MNLFRMPFMKNPAGHARRKVLVRRKLFSVTGLFAVGCTLALLYTLAGIRGSAPAYAQVSSSPIISIRYDPSNPASRAFAQDVLAQLNDVNAIRSTIGNESGGRVSAELINPDGTRTPLFNSERRPGSSSADAARDIRGLLPADLLPPGGGGGGSDKSLVPCKDRPCNIDELKKLGVNIFNWLLRIGGAAALLAVIVAGIRYILFAVYQGADEKSIANAKRSLTYAVAGLAILLLTYVIVNTILTQLGVKSQYRGGLFQ